MQNNHPQGRVLSRMGAREITPAEADQINGSNAAIRSLLSVIRTGVPLGTDQQLDE